MRDLLIFLPCPTIRVVTNQKPFRTKHQTYMMTSLMTIRVPTMTVLMDWLTRSGTSFPWSISIMKQKERSTRSLILWLRVTQY